MLSGSSADEHRKGANQDMHPKRLTSGGVLSAAALSPNWTPPDFAIQQGRDENAKPAEENVYPSQVPQGGRYNRYHPSTHGATDDIALSG
jgi:hypothetical protein